MEKITNVLKDTVSVLYWYEELSSLRLAIFGMVLRNFFFVFLRGAPPPSCPLPPYYYYVCVCVCFARRNAAICMSQQLRSNGIWLAPYYQVAPMRMTYDVVCDGTLAKEIIEKRWEYGTQGSQVITDLSTN